MPPAPSLGLKVIDNKYHVSSVVGRGAFSELYRTREGYAVKVESGPTNLLQHEAETLKALQGVQFVPRFLEYGVTKEYRYLVMELLGESFKEMFCDNDGNEPAEIGRYAVSMLRAIQGVHQRGYIHRDVKPGNFVLSRRNPNSSSIFLVDFGLARNMNNVQGSAGRFAGTLKFASVDAMRKQTAVPQDDLISLFYLIVDAIEGELPWSGLCNDKHNSARILRLKEKETPYLADDIDENLSEYIRLVLERKSGHDYNRLAQLLENMARGVPFTGPSRSERKKPAGGARRPAARKPRASGSASSSSSSSGASSSSGSYDSDDSSYYYGGDYDYDYSSGGPSSPRRARAAPQSRPSPSRKPNAKPKANPRPAQNRPAQNRPAQNRPAQSRGKRRDSYSYDYDYDSYY